MIRESIQLEGLILSSPRTGCPHPKRYCRSGNYRFPGELKTDRTDSDQKRLFDKNHLYSVKQEDLSVDANLCQVEKGPPLSPTERPVDANTS